MLNKQDQFDLDLDTLSSKSKKVRLNGKIMTISPPDLQELFGLQAMARRFDGLDTENLSEDEAKTVFDELTAGLGRLIPELPYVIRESKLKKFLRIFLPRWQALHSKSALTVEQLFELMSLIAEMAVPSNVKELKKQGIELNVSNQKKIRSNRSRK